MPSADASADAPADPARSPLRRRFLGAVAVGALGLAALRPLFDGRWLSGAAPVGVYLAAYVGSNLSANRPPGRARGLSTLGTANAVTLFRGWLLAVLAGALLGPAPNPWVPLALFCVAVSLDVVDGAVARRTHETVLGARLDAAVDALAVLVGGAVAVRIGALPAWYLVAGGVWYAYAGALWLRKRAGEPTFELPPSRVRGPIGIAQFLVVAAGLAPGVGGRPLAAAAGVALAALLASFTRDWAAATGRLGRDDPPVAP